ncbi:MAG TPA: calcium:proton antiporter [Ignavibacteria bacterium]|nr:calcium:proton antiporter [Ignavibacteria bacterium]
MIINFLKKEPSLVLAVTAFIAVTLLLNDTSVRGNLLFETVIFIIVLGVIIFSSLGVVRHAEKLAYKFGEPYGTMILTFSAVIVEIIMISAFVLNNENNPTLARDTIYSTLMILLNGLIGFIMLVGGIRYGEQKFNLKSSNSYLSMIIGIIGLALFLPDYLPDKLEYSYTVFLILICLLLYAFFIKLQSGNHNFYFRFEEQQNKNNKESPEHLPPKSEIKTPYNISMLVSLIVIISLLAEYLSIFIDDEMSAFHFPESIGGLVIAMIIISPEGLTAIRAGLNNDMQRVVNITLGSVLSTISLTIPAVLILSFITGKEIILGLAPVQATIVIISLMVGTLSCKDGETNALQGFIHFALFIAFIFLTIVL